MSWCYNDFMRIDVITLFPKMFDGFLGDSILRRAQDAQIVDIKVHNLRGWSTDKHRTVDSRPYGGGPGMVLKVDVLHPAIEDVKKLNPKAPVVLMTPQGEKYSQKKAEEYSEKPGLILVAGHYEGFDERVRKYVDQEISIGDYVLTGGELPAMVIIDSVVRLRPGVLGDDTSAEFESFSSGSLDFPQYTRPDEYDGEKVPEVLLSGNHAEIDKWREKEAKKKTKKRRPDLVKKGH